MQEIIQKTQYLLKLLNHNEMPFGVYYTNTKPEGGFGPKEGELFTREREQNNQINWRKALESSRCLVGSIWLARKKKKAAYISHSECGCMGGGYYCGLYAPYLETNAKYVSTGIPEMHFAGEHYLPSVESAKKFLEDSAPPLTQKKYCVLKPLDQFTKEYPPLVVNFFVRPEVLNGLANLTLFATGDYQAIVCPFGAGCTSLVAWPLVYQKRGRECAILGGFDLSVRKFLKTDEMLFSVPFSLYQKMLAAMEESALTRSTWNNVKKKVLKSQRAWGEQN